MKGKSKIMEFEQRPVGLLDSGLGGLTVFREVKKQLPQESVIYFADTAHAPYGEKTNQQIMGYVFSIIDFLIQKHAKMIIIACNTATAVSLDNAKKKFPIPIIGVIEPGATAAIEKTKNKRIGIIGTEVTIRNKGYESFIKNIDPTITTFSNACSNHIIRKMEKEALKNKQILGDLMKKCLEPILKNNIDTLVLGCTHYPFLKNYIEKKSILGINLIDSSLATVRKAKILLEEHQLINSKKTKQDSFYISGNQDLFAKISENLLGYIPGEFYKIIL